MNEQEPILIMGTGALGRAFRRAPGRCRPDVTILGSWPAGLRALRKHGIRLREADGRECSYPIGATESPGQVGSVRYALVLVKSWQTARAAEQLTGCLAPDGLALTLQNGAGNREALVRALGATRVAAGATTTGAHLLAPGLVQAAGSGVLSLGAHPGLGPLEDALHEAGLCDGIIRGCRSSRVGQDRD